MLPNKFSAFLDISSFAGKTPSLLSDAAAVMSDALQTLPTSSVVLSVAFGSALITLLKCRIFLDHFVLLMFHNLGGG